MPVESVVVLQSLLMSEGPAVPDPWMPWECAAQEATWMSAASVAAKGLPAKQAQQ